MSLVSPRPTLFLPYGVAAGCRVTLAVETFQHTGSFKYRAAHQVVRSIPHVEVIAASSGNFGQALAFACAQAGKACTVVMPATSSKVKVEAVRRHGATADLIDTSVITREERVAELASEHPDAYVASAYDDPLVIAGNASLGREILTSGRHFDLVVAPVGGGGLTAGIALAFREAAGSPRLVGAEPLMANDAARTLRAGSIQVNEQEPATLADGARTRSIGVHNWAILEHGLSSIVEVPEEAIRSAVSALFLGANLKAEPTGALSVAAVQCQSREFEGLDVLCVISGGNVEPAAYASLIS